MIKSEKSLIKTSQEATRPKRQAELSFYAKKLPLFNTDDVSETLDFFNRLFEPYDREVSSIKSVKMSQESQSSCLMENLGEEAWKISLIEKTRSARPIDLTAQVVKQPNIDYVIRPLCELGNKSLGELKIRK